MKRVLGLLSVFVFAFGLVSLGCDSSSTDEDTKTTVDVVIDNDTNGGNDVVEPGDVVDTDKVAPDTNVCTPNCAGKECGLDGCGGTCGTCANAWDSCVDGQCVCTPECTGKVCGTDGCGGSCGVCATGDCNATGTECVFCPPNCTGKECGPDGCGGTCGTCATGTCNDAGICATEPPPSGCSDIFDCLNACQPTDQACQQNCVNEAAVEDQMAFNSLVSCLQDSGYWDCAEGDNECLSDASNQCQDEIIGCFHGDKSCNEMYACLQSCPNDESGAECSSDCIASGSVEGQKTWYALINCLDTNGYFDCADGDEACLETAWTTCQPAFEACVPPGTATCLEMYLCVSACIDSACSQECLMSGSSEGQTLWNNFINCLDGNGYFDCADGDDACMESAWVACDAVFKECAYGDKTCKEIFDCLNACAPTDQNCALECRVTGTVEG